MAHLTRCWCGRLYRCDEDHSNHGGCVYAFDVRCSCPDLLVHGSPPFYGFTTVTAEVFADVEKLAYTMPITEIIEANSMKEPLK